METLLTVVIPAYNAEKLNTHWTLSVTNVQTNV